MPLEYSFVSRETTVVAEHPVEHGAQHRAKALGGLQSCPSSSGKYTFAVNGHTYYYLVEGGFVFLVVADSNFARQIPSAYLLRIKDEFLSNSFANRGRGCAQNALDRTFGPCMRRHMDYCHENMEELSKIAGLQQSLEEVKHVTMRNFDAIAERQENIVDVQDKANGLVNGAGKFVLTAKDIRNKMWWQRWRMIAITLSLLFIVALIIFLSVCFSGGNCFK